MSHISSQSNTNLNQETVIQQNDAQMIEQAKEDIKSMSEDDLYRLVEQTLDNKSSMLNIIQLSAGRQQLLVHSGHSSAPSGTLHPLPLQQKAQYISHSPPNYLIKAAIHEKLVISHKAHFITHAAQLHDSAHAA